MSQRDGAVIRLICSIFREVKYKVLSTEIFYINGPDNLPPPLSKQEEEETFELLEKAGLSEKVDNYPCQLSGGQQQRVSIARALAGEPSLLLADEPTGALDSKTGREVLDFLRNLNEQGNTIVMITHDNSIASEAKRIVRIHDGKIIEDERVGE